MKYDDKGRIIGCGYCAKEKTCTKHDRTRNQAAEGCEDYLHHEDKKKLIVIGAGDISLKEKIAAAINDADMSIEMVERDRNDLIQYDINPKIENNMTKSIEQLKQEEEDRYNAEMAGSKKRAGKTRHKPTNVQPKKKKRKKRR